MLSDIFSFSYFIIVDDSNTYSYFCGFGENLLSAKSEIQMALKLPKNITELGKNKQSKFQKRLNFQTSHILFPIKYNSFCNSLFEFPCLLPVLIYNKNKFPKIPDVVSQKQNQPLLLELNQDISDKNFIDFFYDRLKSFQENHKNDVGGGECRVKFSASHFREAA